MARQRQKRQIRITREGAYYLVVVAAVLVGGNLRQLNLLMLFGSVLAGPFLFSLIYGRLALRRLAVHRKLPPQLRADQRLMVDVEVTNQRRSLDVWAIDVADLVRREKSAAALDPAVGVSVFFPRISGRESRQVAYEGRLPLRGRYRFGPLKISTRFPLGLVRHSVTLDQAETLLVHPKLGTLTHDWSQVVRENATGSQRMARRGLLDADFYALRDWRAGDSRRGIHWRTSARRGSLVVRQFEQRRSQDLAVLVDLWQPKNPTAEQIEHVETAVSFVATVIGEACRQSGRHLMVHWAARTTLSRVGFASPLFFGEQMDALAVIEPHSEPDFPRDLGHMLGNIPTSMPTLLVSTRPIDWEAFDQAAAEREAHTANRDLHGIDVSGPELARYFQP